MTTRKRWCFIMVLFTEIRANVLQSVQMYKKILSFHPAFYVFYLFPLWRMCRKRPNAQQRTVDSPYHWTPKIPGRRKECAIFSGVRFSGVCTPATLVVNGLRRASEATTPCLVPKYRKIGKRGFLCHFRAEKRKHRTSLPQSTDVLPWKYGCLCQRSPMFLCLNTRILWFFSAVFEVFAAKCGVFNR